jgi:hypothetical protein
VGQTGVSTGSPYYTGYSGNGGAGTVSSITGSPVQYAGGGGGSNAVQGPSDNRGLGTAGGGNGAQGCTTIRIGTNAQANTGSGGGGSTNSGTTAGASGGSGIVIIRYPASLNPPASTTGLQQVLYNNGYQIYVWTSSGTITF